MGLNRSIHWVFYKTTYAKKTLIREKLLGERCLKYAHYKTLQFVNENKLFLTWTTSQC